MKKLVCWLVIICVFISCDSIDTPTMFSSSLVETKLQNEDTTNCKAEYSWIEKASIQSRLCNAVNVPEGYERVEVASGSFQEWLRYLPMKNGSPEVHLYDGTLKYNQSAHYKVVEIDVGKEDLQQCADAVMRLKAEYHYSKKDYGSIHFSFTSGDVASYSKWIEGYRPIITGSKVSWVKKGKYDTSYAGFKTYLKQVFMYAGTSSLSKEMKQIPLSELKAGDVFIKGGFPGHAVLIVDVAIHKKTGEKSFMLVQSYMPAQDIQLLKNPAVSDSPWYSSKIGEVLNTPEWTFKATDLKRFK